MTDKNYQHHHLEGVDPVLSLDIKPPSLHSWFVLLLIVSDNIKVVSDSFSKVSSVDVQNRTNILSN
jgi:hypothetical protein